MRSFGEMFPNSAHTLRVKHYRLFIFLSKLLQYYYSLRDPSHLINKRKLIEGTLPVIINNFNRLNTLSQMINWVQSLKTPTSIIIIDNGSSYQPLLDFYDSLNEPNMQVIKLKRNNEFYKILSISVALKHFDKYAVTDSDLLPYPTTPNDILDKMAEVLDANPGVNHVGTSLEINDIPDHYPFKNDVLEWETQYWMKRNCNLSYKAEVDTTMGMYRSSSLVTRVYPALRMDRPYTLKHVDWYLNPRYISKEHQYYLNHCSSISTWNTKLKEAYGLSLGK